MNLNELLSDPPLLHRDGGVPISWAVPQDLMRELDRRLLPGMRTLETGAGISTLFFALKGCEHIAIAPDMPLFERIRAWAAARDLDFSHVRCVAEPSERVLPRLETPPLDLVLIDGRHGFPAPFIDFYYTEPLLKIGGLLVVDDTQLWTGKVLRDFLREDGAWDFDHEIGGKTAIFKKIADGSAAREWCDQRYVASRSVRGPLARARNGAAMLLTGRWGDFARSLKELTRR